MCDGKKSDCACGGDVTMIYACSGASNVGQMANSIAVELSQSGVGSMGCLAGVGADVKTMVLNAKAADRILMIDGCSVQCGLKSLQKKGVENIQSYVLTDMGVKKDYDLSQGKDELPSLIGKIKSAAGPSTGIKVLDGGNGCGCGCGGNC